MKTFLASVTLSLATIWAQPALTPPQLGFMQDSGNSLRPAFGIAGNFVLGDSLSSTVVSSAFSGSFGLVKTDDSLTVIDRRGQVIASTESQPGSALFGFSRSGAPAFVYLSAENALLAWNGRSFEPTLVDPLSFGMSRVLSIGVSTDGQPVIVGWQDDCLLTVGFSLADGLSQWQVPLLNVAGPVLLLPNGWLIYADLDGVVIRRSDVDTRIAAQLPAHFAFQQMGSDWIEIRGLEGQAQLALRITPGLEQVYTLPQVQQ